MLLCFSATWFRDIKFRSKLSNLIVIMELIIIKLFCKKTPVKERKKLRSAEKKRHLCGFWVSTFREGSGMVCC